MNEKSPAWWINGNQPENFDRDIYKPSAYPWILFLVDRIRTGFGHYLMDYAEHDGFYLRQVNEFL